ncbi:MAG: polyphosphate kinase 1 [Proteobacteria bacterium]|nr:polyphosphate kinase 1 [Pseudomonadota bacterium]
MDSLDLNQPNLYLNRELNLVEFNRRVMAQMTDPAVPLLERLRYMGIASTNMDELFEIRIAGLKQKAELGAVSSGPENMTPHEILRQLSGHCHELIDEQYRILNEELLPALEEEQIRFIRRTEWTQEQDDWLHNYFRQELLPVLSPIGLDPAHPFPRILNKSLNVIVALKGKDAFGRSSGMAVVQAPRSLPRLIQLPQETGSGPYDFVFLSSVIHAYADEMFIGMKVTSTHQFRLTRNSDLFVDEEEVGDLMRALEGELPSRRYGEAVRLEVADNCPDDLIEFLMNTFELQPDDVYQVNGPVNLNRLQAIIDLVERPDLKFAPFTPNLPAELGHGSNLFKVVHKHDILLRQPFDSFAPVIDFVRQASQDPDVLAIKMTLYRTGPESVLVDTLVHAARNGKEVTVVIELRARFDEEANILVANRLQEVGAHVVYGVVGYKTHAKMLLIVRRENEGLRNYVHLGTGNYHASTARLYTDYGLMTCDKEIGEDVHKIFLQLTSLGKVARHNRLLQAPFTLFERIVEKIRRERKNAEKGKPARIIAKINSLVEKQIIQELYAASMAGVEIKLIVRGMCCLRPGVTGVSENIEVRSIVGRFLEHSRVYYFENAGAPEVFCASADWMERNLFRRVETCFPILDTKLRDRIIKDLDMYLADNTQAWILQHDGSYVRLQPGDAPPLSAQQALLAEVTS